MAIEEHPKYREWRAANDKLVETFEMLQTAIRKGEPWHIIKAARQVHHVAQVRYDSIADKLDDA